jgi:hypothetical protein
VVVRRTVGADLGDDGELALETPFVFVGNNVYADRGLGRRSASGSLLVSLDGEVVSMETPLEFGSRPKALVVIAPALT